MICPACETPNADGARYCIKCGALMPVAHVHGDDPLIGQIVGGDFRITGLLGEGGMGRVYVAEQQMGSKSRKVAVKTLLQEFSKDEQVLQRFMRECETVIELEHPNTIAFYKFGRTPAGDLYIAMEFVDGKPLMSVIEDGGPMPYERVDKILKQVCGSLEEAHDKGIVHRDLKPENVILTERAGQQDFVKVLDFGIAKRSDATDAAKEKKLTQAGMVLGTPPYMSPEQFTGKELDRRSDIYALGVMAYEMLTAQLPFKANTPWEWATQHMTAQPFPFEKTGPMAQQIPGHIKDAIMRALSKDPAERQATAMEFYREVNAAGRAAGLNVPTPGVTEAFDMSGGPPLGGGSATAPAGGTQIGDAFAPPGADAGPPPAMMGGGRAPMAGGPVPTGGGQAIPAPPPAYNAGGGGGGGKGMYIAAAGVVGALLVVGIVYAVSGGGGGEDGGTVAGGDTTATSTEAATTGATGDTDTANAGSAGGSAGSDVAPTGTAASTTPPTPQPQPHPQPHPQPKKDDSGTAACDAAISAAIAKNCGAARSALTRCSGPKKHIAAANVNSKCHRSLLPGKR